MADKKLYDNLYKVIKANSGEFALNDIVKTEILDLQIPRGWGARIRRVVFIESNLRDQTDQAYLHVYSALVLDPDDEDSYQIPMFTVDHDVLCDHESYCTRFEEGVTVAGISMMCAKRTEHYFTEEMDAITVRNPRFNSMIGGFNVSGDYKFQMRIEVYFTYEKIPMELYEKLLGIS
jgi:hypothetical protein